MAERPVFVPVVDCEDHLVREVRISFTWHPGMAPSQKKKNIQALHEAAKQRDLYPLLEISTKSDVEDGRRLSAFNLMVRISESGIIPLESAFQGSKVFERGGPYQDLYGQHGSIIKKDERLKASGQLVQFLFDNEIWELEPKTAFYDWLYIHAVHRSPALSEAIASYAGFTDIEFNPQKSINCQARSCALYASLKRRGLLNDVLNDKSFFLNVLGRDSFYQPHSADRKQGKLF